MARTSGRVIRFMAAVAQAVARIMPWRHLGTSIHRQPLEDDAYIEGYLGLASDGTIIKVNRAYCRMSGYHNTDLVGKSIRELETNCNEISISTYLEQGDANTPAVFKTKHRSQLGETLELEVSLFHTSRSLWALECLCRPVGAQSLQDTSDLLRYVIEHSRSAIAIHDCNLRYLYVSQRYRDEYHIPDIDIIGKHHYEVLPDLPQKWRDVHQRCLKGEVLSADDDVYVRPDGSIEWTRWECRPWYTPDKHIGGIVVYTELVTDRKRIEVELRRASEHLEKLIRYANAPIMVWDSGQRITRFNHAFEELSGRTAEELVGHQVGELFPEDQRETILAKLEHQQSVFNAPAIELTIPRTDGSLRTVLWNSSPINDDQGNQRISTIAQCLDITDRKASEHRIAEQLSELQRWYDVMLDREQRVISLKDEVNALLDELGRPHKYLNERPEELS